jgi:hypothetical protein
MAYMLSIMNENLKPAQIGMVLGIYQERLKNDITRMATLKAISIIVNAHNIMDIEVKQLKC